MRVKYKQDHFRQHLLPTPFYPRLSALSQDGSWHGWKGFFSPDYLEKVESEYFAIRNSCSVMDLTPIPNSGRWPLPLWCW